MAASRPQVEATARHVQRQLDHVCTGCVQARASGTLRLSLAAVLAVGNLMNEGSARGEAVGFGLETLSGLMSVRSAGQVRDATAM